MLSRFDRPALAGAFINYETRVSTSSAHEHRDEPEASLQSSCRGYGMIAPVENLPIGYPKGTGDPFVHRKVEYEQEGYSRVAATKTNCSGLVVKK